MGDPNSNDEKKAGVRLSLHLDGVAILAAAVAGYAIADGRWWLFAVLLFTPDLFMLGYLSNTRIGAIIYNVGHTYLLPGCLVAAGLIWYIPLMLEIGLIWVSHIGLDRVFGYGFKYPDSFKSTHFTHT